MAKGMQHNDVDDNSAAEIAERHRLQAEELQNRLGSICTLTDTLIDQLADQGWSKGFLLSCRQGGYAYSPKTDTIVPVIKPTQIFAIAFSKLSETTWDKLSAAFENIAIGEKNAS